MKREINVWDIFWHKSGTRQRIVKKISWDQIMYYDGLWHWFCSKPNFLKMCPREVIITDRDLEIAKKIADWKYEIYLDTKNWKYKK